MFGEVEVLARLQVDAKLVTAAGQVLPGGRFGASQELGDLLARPSFGHQLACALHLWVILAELGVLAAEALFESFLIQGLLEGVVLDVSIALHQHLLRLRRVNLIPALCSRRNIHETVGTSQLVDVKVLDDLVKPTRHLAATAKRVRGLPNLQEGIVLDVLG